MIKVNAIKCRKCESIIFSRAHHDFRWCDCKSTAIDGGFLYSKVTGEPENIEFDLEIEVDADKKALYDDWNSGEDKFGLIKPKKTKSKK